MVVLVGAVAEPLLAGLARSSNVSLVRPPEEEKDPLTAAALALGQAAGGRPPTSWYRPTRSPRWPRSGPRCGI